MTVTRISPEQIEQLAAELTEARERRRPIAPLTETHPDLSVPDAYAIAQRLVPPGWPAAPGWSATRSA